MRIETLTGEQKALFPHYVKKWTDIGLSTEKANRKEAEDGIAEMYALAGLKKPKIVWCDSPMSQGITRGIVQKLENDGELKKNFTGSNVRTSVWTSVRASVRASVVDSVRASVVASVRDSVVASVGASVRDSVRASVWDSVRASVRDSVGASVRDSVRASVRDSVGASVRDSVWTSGYGQHDASWLAFYDFFSEVTKLGAQTNKLSGLWKVSKNAGWYLPHENICWISERHNSLHRNQQGQLHNTRGMALSYPDGWGIYALNGVRFNEELFEKIVSRKMTFEEVLKIEDIDQRKQAMRFINVWDFVKEAKGKELDTYIKIGAKDGRKIRYWLYEFPANADLFPKGAKYMIYDDSMVGAAEQHMHGVLMKHKTVAEAMAWKQSDDLFTLSPQEWEALVLDVDFT
jgi:hypothetical protein